MNVREGKRRDNFSEPIHQIQIIKGKEMISKVKEQIKDFFFQFGILRYQGNYYCCYFYETIIIQGECRPSKISKDVGRDKKKNLPIFEGICSYKVALHTILTGGKGTERWQRQMSLCVLEEE
ncbi:hypothetical protein H1C71_041372 [Ictidomys tridecemlineatus]|nr:hypothetical protein H1C71_041372 [Ictidomys tridecemlineatus]